MTQYFVNSFRSRVVETFPRSCERSFDALLKCACCFCNVFSQRRRTAEDELNMRSMFREGDLISVRVAAETKELEQRLRYMT